MLRSIVRHPRAWPTPTIKKQRRHRSLNEPRVNEVPDLCGPVGVEAGYRGDSRLEVRQGLPEVAENDIVASALDSPALGVTDNEDELGAGGSASELRPACRR